ncbi:hypothetical protein QQS21_004109 [Conoideocrella luteorostrata]|uniref:Hydrophobin n=1 Tax=Conoideocrella luteorostrata TaxID=1105319 RepID=A0AAJ0G1V0_9HYPO|nr:hypothetical protein QQS21_004109 [Conoideocrella luteorostrata]
MLVHIPTLLLAATAAALQDVASGVLSRSALSAMSVQETADKCDSNQQLICCNKSEKCAQIDLDKVNRPDFLYEHCTATVACCQFGTDIDHAVNFGDIEQKCVYMGSLQH